MIRLTVSTADGSPAACVVRPRDASDIDECVRVLAQVHDSDGYPVNWPGRPSEWLMEPSQFASWVAELDGRVVGHIGLSCSGAGDVAPIHWSRLEGKPIQSTAVVSRLFVSPTARGYGIGALLMAEVVRQAQERDLYPVLDVVATDTAAAALYERLGWRLLATVDQRWSPAQTVTVHCYAAPA